LADSPLVSRRTVSGAFLAAVGWSLAEGSAAADAGPRLGPPQAFSFEALKAQAMARSRRPYVAPPAAPASLEQIDYDAAGQIVYRPDATLWKDQPGDAQVRLFHMGRYARDPVAVHVVEGGRARRVVYDERLFSMPAAIAAELQGARLDFAGFRAMTADGRSDWVAYMGASYFRSSGPFGQYGLSARGLAIDTATPRPEEFPAFTAFWLERTAQGQLVVYAALQGPSVEGAYRIAHRRAGDGTVVQEIEAQLNLRADVQRLGIAPLTSMYWYGQDDRRPAADWRPQIHDSDGLAIWTGGGERLWRPLMNPPRVLTNSFVDKDPRGFGLMQRDRRFADYQDDGVFYDKRPSVWIEPIGPWGAGSVQLVEIPTDDETDDNIVAFWTPAAPARAGDALDIRYRIYWAAEEPAAPGVARVIATRRGRGGRPGQPPAVGVAKFAIDFSGPGLADLTRQSGVEAVVSADGVPLAAVAYPVVGTPYWRLIFDLPFAGRPQAECRAFLRHAGQALTETWTYLAMAAG
jgi:glucans biosynthesis protein